MKRSSSFSAIASSDDEPPSQREKSMDLKSIGRISYDDSELDKAIFEEHLKSSNRFPSNTFQQRELFMDIVQGSEGLDQKYATRAGAKNVLAMYEEKLIPLLEDGWNRRSFTAIRRLGKSQNFDFL